MFLQLHQEYPQGSLRVERTHEKLGIKMKEAVENWQKTATGQAIEILNW